MTILLSISYFPINASNMSECGDWLLYCDSCHFHSLPLVGNSFSRRWKWTLYFELFNWTYICTFLYRPFGTSSM